MKATVRCETPWATPASELKASSAPARESCQRAIAAKLSTVDLGRTGEVIGATVRAKYELDREKAEAATRLARALNDAELQEKLTGRSEAGWRYRKTDLWRDLAKHSGLQVSVRRGPGGALVGVGEVDEHGPDAENLPAQIP